MKRHNFWGKIRDWLKSSDFFAINKISFCQLGLVLVIYKLVANSDMYRSENDEPYLKSTLMKTSKVLGY